MNLVEESAKRRIYLYYDANGDLMYSGLKDTYYDAYHFHFYQGPMKIDVFNNLVDFMLKDLAYSDKMKASIRREMLRHMMFK